MITRSRSNPKLFTEFGAKQQRKMAACPECNLIEVCPAPMELGRYFALFFTIRLTFFAPIGRNLLAGKPLKPGMRQGINQWSSADKGIKICRSVEPLTQEKIFITNNEKTLYFATTFLYIEKLKIRAVHRPKPGQTFVIQAGFFIYFFEPGG